MARIVKEEEYAEKRNAILDVAQRLVYSKGYEQMTIQDILDDLQISKGAFYHYFGSKPVLLEALVERMGLVVEKLVLPIMHDPELTALQKLQHFFDTLNRFKIAQKDFLLALLQGWYKDENAIVRHKLMMTTPKVIKPFLAEIIQQGNAEGVFSTFYPEQQVSDVVLALTQALGDTLGLLLLSSEPSHDNLQDIECTVAAYNDALERILGTPRGSLSLVDTETLKEWFVSKVETGDNGVS
jgi:AcrR family transcriptional regulator